MSQESRLRGRTYTPGFSDALGDRFLARGPGDEPVLEVLEFKSELSDEPDFEEALRARIDVVRGVKHHSIAVVHGVERRDGSGLCLVSEHIAGRRLSELEPSHLGPAFALEVIRTVTPVLCELNQAGVGVADGVLSADRIVVAADGRLVVVEHVLGWAFESLRLPRQRLNDLGIVVDASERFNRRTDMLQLGFLALSLLLRRRLDPADCPARIPALLDEAGDDLSTGARAWFERALQIGPKPFASAHEALDALDELDSHDDNDVMVDEANALLEFADEDPGAATEPSALPHAAPSRAVATATSADLRALLLRPDKTPAAPQPAVPSGRGLRRVAAWILGAVSFVAIGYVIAIVVLPFSQAPANVIVTSARSDAAPAGAEIPEPPPSTTNPPLTNKPAAPTAARPARNTSQGAVVRPGPPNAGRRAAAPITPYGSLTMTSAIALQVFLDGRLIGTTGRTIALPEGTHQIEVVNEELDFRQVQAVRVGSGAPTSVRVALPTGRMSLNATPWADVTIDGAVVGQTPIANYALPIGTHVVVFRHPQLGVRSQTVVVKAGATLRVTEAFQQR